MTAGVSRGILRLAEKKRISATSVMSGCRHWPDLARELMGVADRIDIGLHLNLTMGAPVTAMRSTAPAGLLPAIGVLTRKALTGSLDRQELATEIDAQLARFEDEAGRAPDYVDGHQHAHALPVIRDVLLARLAQRYAVRRPYVRNPWDAPLAILARRSSTPKAMAVAALAGGLYALASKSGVALNRGFAGFSAFDPGQDYAAAFARYLVRPGPAHLVMCHPGEIDEELRMIDPVVETRAQELAFFESARMDEICGAAGLMPRRFAEL